MFVTVRHENTLAEKRKKEDRFFDTFSAKPEDEPEETSTIFTIYLWDCNKAIYDIYLTAKEYISAELELDSTVLINLIQDSGENLTNSLRAIPYIQSGYISTIVPKVKENGGK